MIDIVASETLSSLESSISAKRIPSSVNGYESWKRYHEALCATASRYGKVGSWDPNVDVDFYYSGDWFHEHYDGFALRSLKALRSDALHDLQKVVSRHHSEAVLSMSGDIDQRIWGLEILITPEVILLAWRGMTVSECESQLKELGVNLDTDSERSD